MKLMLLVLAMVALVYCDAGTIDWYNKDAEKVYLKAHGKMMAAEAQLASLENGVADCENNIANAKGALLGWQEIASQFSSDNVRILLEYEEVRIQDEMKPCNMKIGKAGPRMKSLRKDIELAKETMITAHEQNAASKLEAVGER